MKSKIFVSVFVMLLVGIKSFSQSVTKTYPGVAVVELFTSQGDINCPKADKILSDLIAAAEKNNKPVYCISLHVDFWNRFGWKDPFSSLKFTNRLQNYSSVFGDKETYTPRFVINGKPTPDSPDMKNLSEIINKELSSKAMMNPVFTYQLFDDTLDISYDVKFDLKKNNSGSTFYINIVVLENSQITKVTKGDNEGKTLRNDNVARFFYTTDLRASRGLIRVPFSKIKPGPGKSILIFIQDKKSKEVAGASANSFN